MDFARCFVPTRPLAGTSRSYVDVTIVDVEAGRVMANTSPTTVAHVLDPRIANAVAEGLARLADCLTDLRCVLGPDAALGEAAAQHLCWLADHPHPTISRAAALFADIIEGHAAGMWD